MPFDFLSPLFSSLSHSMALAFGSGVTLRTDTQDDSDVHIITWDNGENRFTPESVKSLIHALEKVKEYLQTRNGALVTVGGEKFYR